MDQQPDKKAVGKPFKKGQSGNPSGRPAVVKHIRDLARSHGEDAFRRVLQLMQSDDERVALTASQEVLNRAYGKPTQHIETKRTEVTELPDGELAELLGAVRAIAAQVAADGAGEGAGQAVSRKPLKALSTLQ